jgi:hypothetical protein
VAAAVAVAGTRLPLLSGRDCSSVVGDALSGLAVEVAEEGMK